MTCAAVDVQLLGPVLVTRAGEPVTNFRSHKTLALLAYLVATRRPVARNYLAELLWPETSATDGRGHLRRAIHDLTQKLPNALIADYYTVAIDPACFGQSDLARFEALRRLETESELREAAGLCRGPFLEGIDLDDCLAFEAWLTAERETWRQRETAVVERLLALHLQNSCFERALEAGWQLLRLEPWREERYSQLMMLLARNGDPGMAVKVYKRYRRTLVDELNVEPSAELLALYDRLGRAKVRRPGNLPSGLTPFVGRSQELELLARYLADPACRIITLAGPGGIGKTRLALEAARRATLSTANRFLDGAFFAPLDSAGTPAQFLSVLAHALGIASAGRTVGLDMVLRHLRDRELLLLLDDFDSLVDHSSLLIALLEADPALKILVTCQERLNLPAEWVVPVRGLAGDQPGFGASEALMLFENCLLRYGRPPLSSLEREIAARICELVEGMPLAIELAASWLSRGSFQHAVEVLETNLDVLSMAGARPNRHSSVRSALDHTWSRLKPEEREALGLLAVFPGGFTGEEAKRIATVGARRLGALVDKSLVSIANAASGSAAACYRLHALVRQYAGEQLPGNAELQARASAVRATYLSHSSSVAHAAPQEPAAPWANNLLRALLPPEHCILV